MSLIHTLTKLYDHPKPNNPPPTTSTIIVFQAPPPLSPQVDIESLFLSHCNAQFCRTPPVYVRLLPSLPPRGSITIDLFSNPLGWDADLPSPPKSLEDLILQVHGAISVAMSSFTPKPQSTIPLCIDSLADLVSHPSIGTLSNALKFLRVLSRRAVPSSSTTSPPPLPPRLPVSCDCTPFS